MQDIELGLCRTWKPSSLFFFFFSFTDSPYSGATRGDWKLSAFIHVGVFRVGAINLLSTTRCRITGGFVPACVEARRSASPRFPNSADVLRPLAPFSARHLHIQRVSTIQRFSTPSRAVFFYGDDLPMRAMYTVTGRNDATSSDPPRQIRSAPSPADSKRRICINGPRRRRSTILSHRFLSL